MEQTATAPAPNARIEYPSGFRPRRGMNWVSLGLMYASYYVCRYNFRFATPGLVAEFGFSKFQITKILGAWSMAYGIGQLVNGLLTDRIGGRIAMLIGAAGTIIMNLMFGVTSFAGTFTTFALIWGMNGYFQSFGAPDDQDQRGVVQPQGTRHVRRYLRIYYPVGAGGHQQSCAPDSGGLYHWHVDHCQRKLALAVPHSAPDHGVMHNCHGPLREGDPGRSRVAGLIHDEVDSSAGVRMSIGKCFQAVFTHPAGLVLCGGLCLHGARCAAVPINWRCCTSTTSSN